MLLGITGFSSGNGVVVAQHYGAGDEKRVRENASTGILLIMIMGIVSTLLGLVIARPAYTYLVNVPEDFLELTLVYFRIYAIGLIFQFGYNIFSSILRAVGDSAATLYFLLIASVLNIILDLVFVAGFHWGVAGAAIATDIAQAASGSIITLFALSEQAAGYCLAHLHTVALINIILSMYIPLFGVFQRANHSGVPTVVATGALGMRVLVTYLFRYSSFLGYFIIWWNGLFGVGMGFLIAWSYYFSGRWQRNSAISDVPDI